MRYTAAAETAAMLFNSLEFAVFLPLLLLVYYLCRRRAQNLVLLVAGYVFYGFWDVRFLYLVSVSTVLDFCTGLMMSKGRMTLAQRLQPSAHVLGFALLFLVPDWKAVHFGGQSLVHADFARLLSPNPFGLRVLAITLVVVGLAHAFYPRLSALPESRRRLFFLRCSLIGQLGMLGVFKYYNFFIDSANALAGRIGLDASALRLDIVLPIGISFYTFQTLSYVCDIYFRRMEPAEHLLDFALFVSYFPPLVAGPIERASHLLPRILGERRVKLDNFFLGAHLILLGLFKKMAIADGIAGSVASVYNTTGHVGWADVALGTAAFAAQIYCDFSGYSDIASGCSLFFGIDLLKNFELPYFSINPSEFWRRWHISLSTWLRDYLYIPLGGNRGSELRTYRNLMLTMVIGGLWHGAAWNFVLWGFYQGLLLVVHRLWVGRHGELFTGGLLRRLPRMAFFFLFICYGWLLFRANSFSQIAHFSRILLSDFSDLHLHMKAPTLSVLLGIPMLALLEVLQFQSQSETYLRRLWPAARGAIYAGLIVLTIFGASNESQQFIYFQF